MGGAFLEWALEAFSGYAAVDELYEGPYCVLSAVDNRHYKRVLYEVLDHDATHTDIEAFLGRLKTALDERGLALQGITTDGSALYPEPIRIVFGDVPHQLCTFHMIKDLTQGVLKAVAKERERLARSKPKLKRGRPSSKDQEARRRARKSKSIQQKISDLFPTLSNPYPGEIRYIWHTFCPKSWRIFLLRSVRPSMSVSTCPYTDKVTRLMPSKSWNIQRRVGRDVGCPIWLGKVSWWRAN
jgi:hypothetical protein